MDNDLVVWQHDQPRALRFRPARNKGPCKDPFRVMNPARKRPTSLHSIAARDGFGLTFGEERTGHRRNAIGEHWLSTGRRKVGPGPRARAKDAKRPARSTVDPR